MRFPSLSVPVGGLLAFAALGLPRAVPAQTLLSVASGFTVGGPSPAPAPGLAFEASVGRQHASAAAWRVDAFVSQTAPDNSGTPTIAVAGFAASELLTVMRPASRAKVYVIGGVETDYLFQIEPPNAWRPGASGGLGVAVSPEGQTHGGWFLEVRYHWVIDPPPLLGRAYGTTWFLPVTVGVRL